ncbi:MAG: hypothetical protein K1X71_18565 [Pirellulales bacterium]|nr:hypothetical protein [Pirellulales bacterium]
MTAVRQICPDLPTFLHELRWNAAAVTGHGVLWASYTDTARVRHLVASARVALPTFGTCADTLSLELDLACGLNSVFAAIAQRQARQAIAGACAQCGLALAAAEWAPLALRASVPTTTRPVPITREIILDRAEAQV